ncbi:MAG: polysaccharide deacetylase family protein [Dehalococcoidales bacterium]|nr:polysaccharide deacetylase family protein [Dehalococcoidales bacterium]
MDIAITIDVESDWGGRTRQCDGIEYGLPVILQLLESLEIKATFFISGVVITRYQKMIRKISESEHELASHSFSHQNHSLLNKEQLFEEVNRSKHLLEDETGAEVLGFRTPQFRTNKELFDVLGELHFGYDSSFSRGMVPTRYHGSSVPKAPFLLENGLLEIPVSSLPYIRMPLGFRWLNLIGFTTFKFLLDRLVLPQPVVFYLHPFDLIQPAANPEISFFIKRWYSYKTPDTKKTLERILSYLKKRGDEFILLKDIFHRSKEAG